MTKEELIKIQAMAIKKHKHLGPENNYLVYFTMEDVWRLMYDYKEQESKEMRTFIKNLKKETRSKLKDKSYIVIGRRMEGGYMKEYEKRIINWVDVEKYLKE